MTRLMPIVYPNIIQCAFSSRNHSMMSWSIAVAAVILALNLLWFRCEAIQVSIRLQGPLSENGTGRVEILHDGQWGRICDDEWDIKDAKVVCRQLGYLYAVNVLHGHQVPSGSGPFWLDDVDCTGNEKKITSCQHGGWGKHDCKDSESAGVECTSTAVEATLRLQGPLSANGTGRVEVFHDGQWGSICDEGWDRNDARVACRQLGYPDAIKPLLGLQVPIASGRIWLFNVACTGREQNITSCPHPGWGTSKCSHFEDAGVQCKRREKPTVTIDCSKLITVHQGDNVTCVCCGEGGIPAASVTWYKKQTQVGETEIGQQTLALNNVDVTDSGTYRCVAKSGQFTEEKSIEVVVYVMSGYLRLQGPLKNNGTGRVEIFHNGQWGTICGNNWDIRDARVVCRQLGYADAVSFLRGYQVSSGSGPIWLSNVACTGSEQNITDCPRARWGENNCTHFKDAGVECTTTGVFASVRLKGPLSDSGNGRVEILHNGQWGTICDDGWDLNDAKVVCRQLGYLDAVRYLSGYMVPSGDGQIWLVEVDCTGRESSLTNCSNTGWGKSSNCRHSDDAGVECSNSKEAPPLRLAGPLSKKGAGRVEVFYNGKWGTICDDKWNTKNARVVCRQLGYLDATRTLQRGEVSPGSGPIWLDNVACTGREQSLDKCYRGGWGHNYCSHYEDAGVECTSSAITMPLRLRGPSSESGIGRVEVLHNGTWGTICDNGWDLRDARVACRQIGYLDAVKALRQGEVHFSDRKIWLELVDCTGREQQLKNCSYVGWGKSHCEQFEDAGVECTATAITAQLRLKGPYSESGTGRVEVYYNGTWGTICDDGWDMKDARVVCRQLGYKDAVRALHGHQVPSGSSSVKMWLDEVDCTGNERNIADCSHIGWGTTDCGTHENAGVKCTSTAVSVSLRIQGPSSANGTGRIEVLYNGQWGTVCDDGWDIEDARVVCRQLGYVDALRSLQGNQVTSGWGPIWLDEVDCTGREKNLTECSNAGWGNSNCAHSEDAGVQCVTTEKPTVTIDCPSLITMHPGDKVTCVCRVEGGIPAASVRWYKENIQIGGIGMGEQKLVLRNVAGTDRGTYKCVAQSDDLEAEKSIEILVLDKLSTTSLPQYPSYTTIQSATKAVFTSPYETYKTVLRNTPTSSIENNTSRSAGKSQFQTGVVTSHKIYTTRVLKSSFTGLRSRSVTSSHYDSSARSSKKTFATTVLENIPTFSYQSIVTYQPGRSSKGFTQNVVAKPTSALNTRSSEKESTVTSKSKNAIDLKIVIVTILVPGIVAGSFVPCVVFYCYRRGLRKKITEQNHEEIDLAKMNGENSESLVGLCDDTDQLI